MKLRMRINKIEPHVYEAMQVSDKIIKSFDIEPRLKELIKIKGFANKWLRLLLKPSHFRRKKTG